MIRTLIVLLLNFAICTATETEMAKSCIQNANDLYDPARVFKSGFFNGKCVDATSVRPVQILAEDTKQIIVANFYDRGRFWRATVPRHSVRQVLFQIVPFESGVPLVQAAHTQFRFLLKPEREILLEAQEKSPGEKSSTQDVIISSTYTAPSGEEYSALKSLGASYGIVTRFMSSIARGKEEIGKDKSIVRQFILHLSEAEMTELLFLALKRSATDGYSQSYNLRSNNCTTIAFELLDQLRPSLDVAPVQGSLWNIRDEFIGPSIKGLRDRNLIDNKSEIAPMNAEMKF